MSQVFNYSGYEIELRETGEANVALFQTNPLERRVMVTSTVSEGVEVLRDRVRALIDLEIGRATSA